MLKEVIKSFGDGPGEPETEARYYRIVECMGCNSVKYMTSQARLDTWDDGEEFSINVYPDGVVSKTRRAAPFPENDSRLPDAVSRMYSETLGAINAGSRTLAAVGLRATVEAICLDKGVDERDLEKKIDALVGAQHLSKPEADFMHEQRYLGNAAVHEMQTPDPSILESGLEIVEHLISAMYIIPTKAARMKEERMGRSSDKRPS